MGKKNPIKSVVSAMTDITYNPAREIARAVGADGIVKGIDKWKDTREAIGHGAVDLANDEKGKQKKKQEEAQREADATARSEADAAGKRAAAAENKRIEDERMSAGSKSRTLLTGPSGLEDDEDVSISRRTLSGLR